MTDTAHQTTKLAVFVAGKPAPQGSKRYLGTRNGKSIAVESSTAVAPWRADIREHVRNRLPPDAPISGPIHVHLEFVMPRTTGTPKKSTPPHTKKPDIDKLARAVLDALSSAGLWHDDSHVTDLQASKRIGEADEPTGCHIRIHRPQETP